MKNAYPYARWSTLEQSKGSTLERQLANGGKMAEANEWLVASTIIDDGKSAYTGANIKTGNLGKFAKSILSGEIDGRETVLIVEELDRLSRQPAPVMLGWLTPLLTAGLTVGVAQTGQLITMDSMTGDIGSFLQIMLDAFGSHKESKKKSERVGSAWRSKREKLAKGEGIKIVAHRHPKWLKIVEGRYELDPVRARLVREIFALNLSGHGKGAIALLFNQRMKTDLAYDTWQLGKRKPKLWTDSRIGKILHSETVLGLWQPHRHPRGGERVSIGKPLKLYPAVIDEETFNRANARRHQEQMRYQGRGRALSNMLGMKARCEHCEGPMAALGSARVRTNKDGSMSRHYFLYCYNAKRAASCQHVRGWTYDRIEKPLLDRLLLLAMDDQHFSNDNDASHVLEAEVLRLRRRLDDQTKGAQALLKLIRQRPTDDILATEYDTAAGEIDATKSALEAAQADLARARGQVSPAEHVKRVQEVRADMDSENEAVRYEARKLVKAALQDILDSVTFNHHTGTVIASVAGGLRYVALNDRGEIVDDHDGFRATAVPLARSDAAADYLIRLANDPEFRKARSQAKHSVEHLKRMA